MPSLADLQRAFSRAVLDGDARTAGLPAFVGLISPDLAFEVHHGTVMGGLTNALRLTYPTVDALVGSEFFDHAALTFIAAEPPTMANLSGYGGGYPGFLERFEPVRDLPYLSDVATLDLAIDRVHRSAAETPFEVRLDAHVNIKFAATLTVLELSHPVNEIRSILVAGDPDALRHLAMTPQQRFVAVWRSAEGATVRPLGAMAGAFLDAILRGMAIDAAFDAALRGGDPDEALAEIQAQVFAAPFTTIVPIGKD